MKEYRMERMEDITIPNGQEKIEKNEFRWRRSLRTITIPDGVKTIDRSAFYECVNMQSVIMPDSVTAIGNYAFYYCRNLKNITMSNNLESIGNYAFYWCSSLTDIILPDSLADIGDYAFYWCRKLTVHCSESQKLVEAYCRTNKIKMQYTDSKSTIPQSTTISVIEKEITAFINEIDSFKNLVPGVVFSSELSEIKNILAKIMILLKEEKDIESSSGQLKAFVNYYFPTIKKLLDAYSQIETQNLHGESALETKKRIAESMPFIQEAFEKELDNICYNKMIDITTDIDVLEAMFAKDGLLDSKNPFKT